MKINDQESKQALVRTLIWSIGSTLIGVLLLSLLYQSPIGQDIDYRVATTLEFRLREALGKSPTLDPRIRIFGFDDKSFSAMKRSEFNIEEWAIGLYRLALDRPKVIIIDKLFSFVHDPNGKLEPALKLIASLQVPIVVGSFVTPQAISYRDELSLEKNLYHLPYLETSGVSIVARKQAEKWQEYQNKPEVGPEDGSKKLQGNDPYALFKDFRGHHIYGPDPRLREVFHYVGHLQYSGHTKASPFMRLQDHFGVPHAGLFAADSLAVANGLLQVNGISVPLDGDGDTVVNLAPTSVYYKNFKRLHHILNPDRSKPLVNEGDVVLILLNMYTGGTDFHLTPFGYAPGGFILATMINSALKGNWIRKLSGSWVLIVLSCVLGGILGAFTGTLVFWLSLIAGICFLIALGVLLFSYVGAIIPWLWMSLAFASNAMMIFAEKTRYHEKKAQRLQLVEAERRILEKELKEAAEIAKAYKPDPLPEWPSYLIGGYHQAITAASGDWFAFESSRTQKYLHMIMCDITGHGVQAALVVSACKTLLGNIKSMCPDWFEDKDFMCHYMQLLNQVLWKQGQGQHVTTLLVLTFEPEAQTVHYLAAGHPYPLLRQAGKTDDKPTPLISRHNPIGIAPSCEPKPKQIAFVNGDEIFAFTDGVPLSDHRRLLKKFPPRESSNIKEGPKQLYDQIWAMEKERSGKIPDDDVSMLWFKAI